MPDRYCTSCEWLDQESRKRWDRAVEHADGQEWEDPTKYEGPQFNARYAYCTNPRNKRQPKQDMVAGTHLDGAPWLTCQEIRRMYPDCPDWKERQNAD